MKNMPIRNAIWRSRAVAIIGFLVMFLAIFPGLPSALENTLFVVFGLLTLSFGLAGSRHKSYAEPGMIQVKVMETEEPQVIEQSVPVQEIGGEEEIVISVEEDETN